MHLHTVTAVTAKISFFCCVYTLKLTWNVASYIIFHLSWSLLFSRESESGEISQLWVVGVWWEAKDIPEKTKGNEIFVLWRRIYAEVPRNPFAPFHSLLLTKRSALAPGGAEWDQPLWSRCYGDRGRVAKGISTSDYSLLAEKALETPRWMVGDAIT